MGADGFWGDYGVSLYLLLDILGILFGTNWDFLQAWILSYASFGTVFGAFYYGRVVYCLCDCDDFDDLGGAGVVEAARTGAGVLGFIDHCGLGVCQYL